MNYEFLTNQILYLAHVIEQPNLRIPNPQYLQLNFCFDFFNDSENTFWGFSEIQKELEKVAWFQFINCRVSRPTVDQASKQNIGD